MKFLESVGLDDVNSMLSNGSWRFSIEPRVENYSCKMVADDKRQFKEMVRKAGGDMQVLSPPQTNLISVNSLPGDESPTSHISPINGSNNLLPPYPCYVNHSTSLSTSEGEEVSGGPESGQLCSTIATKTLFYLISTLNASFNPYYDFSNASSDEFCREPESEIVVFAINEILNTYLDNFASIKDRMWQLINEEITINQCSVYSYRPDHQSDPYSEGCIASFNYFFYNKHLKRILFFSVKISGLQSGNNSACQEEDDEMNYDSD